METTKAPKNGNTSNPRWAVNANHNNNTTTTSFTASALNAILTASAGLEAMDLDISA